MDNPIVGSVWGDPERPETWRRVWSASTRGPSYATFHSGSRVLTRWDIWSAWLAASGAVDITECVRHGAQIVSLKNAVGSGLCVLPEPPS